MNTNHLFMNISKQSIKNDKLRYSSKFLFSSLNNILYETTTLKFERNLNIYLY